MKYVLILTSIFLSFSIFSIEYKEAKLTLWKKGEALYGDEFIANNEDVVDYLSQLERPIQNFKTIKYKCQAKSRTISPSSWTVGGNSNETTYTYITTVYGLKDCEKI